MLPRVPFMDKGKQASERTIKKSARHGLCGLA